MFAKILRFVCLLFVLTGTAMAAEKMPSRYDEMREFYLDTGHQNMPFKLWGVSMTWHRECQAGKVAQCVKLAEAFETGLGPLRADMRVALGYWRLACKAGSGHGCARTAEVILSGEANFVNVDMARQFAKTGCETYKTPKACSALAQALMRGPDAAQNRAQADALIAQACAANDDDGCRIQARQWFDETTDVALNKKAVPLFEKGCAAKQAWGCSGLAEAYNQGKGVPLDATRARAAAETGCVSSTGDRVRACRLYGMFLIKGDKASLNKGEKFLDTSCQAGDGVACVVIGQIGMYGKRPGATTNQMEGLYFMRRGCDLNNGQACDELSYAYQKGLGIPGHGGVTIALLDKSCRLGWANGCKYAKMVADSNPGIRGTIPKIDPSLTVTQQLAEAQTYVKSASAADRNEGVNAVVRLMQEGNEDAAWVIGGWLVYGLDGVFDTSRKAEGIIAIENAARVGHVEAAIWIGMAYWYGDGVKEDRKKGENYMLIAASRGSEMAEGIYRSMLAEPIRVESKRRAEEFAAYQKAQYERWSRWNASAYANYVSAGSTYTPYKSSSYSGQSVSSIIDNSNWNQMYNYLSGSTTACPSSNPYCR
ncbi:hypothetical protein PQU92_01630 [Asticcacaulis sp. BYS171W]|uniref:Beta-lactamase n=1 Tax=Asticcacaulis aquaticus TaxID=2984212 RepID=A0ABT5HPG6_9CAUL|nr:hypothetical protein [Asticcacaulis aquaticus]MDC7681958.1 hypothetical protein [Asticcacaulis aquaticus]